MLMVLSGACGSGKSTVIRALRGRWPDVIARDDDDELPDGFSDFLSLAVADQTGGRATLLGSQQPVGALLAAEVAIRLERIAVCHLDCHDVERTRRVRARQADADEWFDQHHLNWAAFHRMHAVESTWHQAVLTGGNPTLFWNRWIDWKAGDPRWQFKLIDTTGLTSEVVAEQVGAWVRDLMAHPDHWPLRGQWWGTTPYTRQER